MLRILRNNNFIVNISIILLAISPAFALGEGNRNLLLIGAMILSPLSFLRYPIFLPKVDSPLIALVLLMIGLPLIFHPETLRWSTVLYSCMFCMYFMSYARVLFKSTYTLDDLAKLLKWLLFAYCIVLMIQQFCVLSGLPIFNLSNYDIHEPWKLNSLMSEPSHSARIIPILMYLFVCYQKYKNPNLTLKESFQENKLVWFSFLWPVLTMVSTTAFIFLVIVLAKFINIRKFIPTIILLTLAGFAFFSLENKSIKRAQKVILATLTLDETTIIRADHSASFRIVPTLQGAKAVGLFSGDDWVGHGVDADQRLIKPLPTVKTGNAGAFFIWFNFGIIAALIFWIFSFKTCFLENDLASILVWFLCVFIYGGLNNQIIWLVLALLYTYKFILLKENKI